MPSAPTKRAALTAGVIGDRLYAAGGVDPSGPQKRLEIFDFAKRRWSTGPSMLFSREHLAGAVSGSAFYVLSGRASGQGNFTFAERFVPKRNRWETLPRSSKPRGGIAAATLADGRIVLLGGEEAEGTIEEVELYDPKRRRWSKLPSMRTPRHGLGAVARGQRVYAIEGGVQPGLFYSDAIEALDVKPAP
jgi:N-acetylneuraminic acid mutarotase